MVFSFILGVNSEFFCLARDTKIFAISFSRVLYLWNHIILLLFVLFHSALVFSDPSTLLRLSIVNSFFIAKCLLSHFSHVRLFATLWTIAHQAPRSIGFSRQEYCSGLPFASPGDLPNPVIKPVSHVSCISRWVLYH